VTSVSAAEVTHAMAVNTMQVVLGRRTPGAQFTRADGTAGTGSRIELRGAKSFNLTSDPLMLADGLRSGNNAERGRSLGAGRTSNPLEGVKRQAVAGMEIA